MSARLAICALAPILSATIPGAAIAQAAPTPLIPPSITLQPPAGGGQAPAAPIETTPLPPAGATEPQGEAPPVEAKPAPAQPQAAAPQTTPPATAELPPAPPQWPDTWSPGKTADLQVLDKIEGVVTTLKVPVGQSVTYGSLTITIQACVVRPPDQPADAAAFMTVTDSHKDAPGFRGWTLENEPWVSMLQSPVYDVEVEGCEG